MKRKAEFTHDMGEPPRKRLKTLHIRRKGYVPRYTTRAKITAVRVIQRFWLFYKRLSPMCQRCEDQGNRGFIRQGGKNVICPITQDGIKTQECFKFVSTKTGHVYAYTIEDLVGYFKSSGNFRCPLTREEFSRPVVRRLAIKAVKIGLSASNLSGMYEMRDSIMRRTIERDNRLLAIENQCAIAMTDCLDMCQNLNVSTTAAASQLLNELIPEWKALVDQYANFSRNDCIIMLRSDRDKMLRLMRSDIRDPHELINFLKTALEEKIEQVSEGRTRTIRRRLFAPSFFSNASELLREQRNNDTDAEHNAISVVENILGPLAPLPPLAPISTLPPPPPPQPLQETPIPQHSIVQIWGENENANLPPPLDIEMGNAPLTVNEALHDLNRRLLEAFNGGRGTTTNFLFSPPPPPSQGGLPRPDY